MTPRHGVLNLSSDREDTNVIAAEAPNMGGYERRNIEAPSEGVETLEQVDMLRHTG
jgi:hypothetical protein